jgi:hypothetical protein
VGVNYYRRVYQILCRVHFDYGASRLYVTDIAAIRSGSG